MKTEIEIRLALHKSTQNYVHAIKEKDKKAEAAGREIIAALSWALEDQNSYSRGFQEMLDTPEQKSGRVQ